MRSILSNSLRSLIKERDEALLTLEVESRIRSLCQTAGVLGICSQVHHGMQVTAVGVQEEIKGVAGQ